MRQSGYAVIYVLVVDGMAVGVSAAKSFSATARTTCVFFFEPCKELITGATELLLFLQR